MRIRSLHFRGFAVAVGLGAVAAGAAAAGAAAARAAARCGCCPEPRARSAARCASSPARARCAPSGCSATIAPSSIAIRAAIWWCAPKSSPSTSPTRRSRSAVKARFSVLRTQELADLGVKITVLQTPEGWSAQPRPQAAAQARSRRHVRLQPHLFRQSGEVARHAGARRRRASPHGVQRRRWPPRRAHRRRRRGHARSARETTRSISSAATASPCPACTARRSRILLAGPPRISGRRAARGAVCRGRVLRAAHGRRGRSGCRRARLDGARARGRHQHEPGRAAQRTARTRGRGAGGPRPPDRRRRRQRRPGGAAALSRRVPTASSASRRSTRNITCCSRPAAASTSTSRRRARTCSAADARRCLRATGGARHFVRRADRRRCCSRA